MKMKLKKALKILETHNKWRRGADIEPTHPKLLGESIDIIVKFIKQSENIKL